MDFELFAHTVMIYIISLLDICQMFETNAFLFKNFCLVLSFWARAGSRSVWTLDSIKPKLIDFSRICFYHFGIISKSRSFHLYNFLTLPSKSMINQIRIIYRTIKFMALRILVFPIVPLIKIIFKSGHPIMVSAVVYCVVGII